MLLVGRVNHITRKASSLARTLIMLICHIIQGSFVPKLGPGFLWTPERLLLQWTTPSITPVDNPVHLTTGRPCLQANCLSRPLSPDHPHRMTRRPVTRMPRVTTLPPNVTCRRVTHSVITIIQAFLILDIYILYDKVFWTLRYLHTSSRIYEYFVFRLTVDANYKH